MAAAPVNAQAFSQDIDKPVPRLCRDNCEQKNEQMVVDTAGNATAVWLETYRDGSGEVYDSIVASRYSASASAWSTPTRLTYYDTSSGIKFALTTAANGRARLVYAFNYNFFGYVGHSVSFSEFVPGIGWQSLGGYQDNYAEMGNLTLASGRNGDQIASYGTTRFSRSGSTYDQVFLHQKVGESRTRVKTGAAAGSFHHYAIDDDGGVIGIQYGNTLRIMRLDLASQNWYDARTLDWGGSGITIAQLKTTADRNGNTMLLYERRNTTNNSSQIRTFRFQKSISSWSSKSVPAIASSRVYGQPSIHGDRYGNYYATWVQYSGAYMKTIAARYSNSKAVWSQPIVISRGSYHTREAAVTNDYAGNAIFTWSQRNDTGTGSSTGKIFRQTVVRYSNATWGTPTVIQDVNRIGYKPFIGAGNDGRITVLWTQDSSVVGIKEIRSDRLTPK